MFPLHCIHLQLIFSKINEIKTEVRLKLAIKEVNLNEICSHSNSHPSNTDITINCLLELVRKTMIMYTKYFSKVGNGILLQKLFWPSVRKNWPSDREKLLKFEAEGLEFANILRLLEQFIQTVKGQNNFW